MKNSNMFPQKWILQTGGDHARGTDQQQPNKTFQGHSSEEPGELVRPETLMDVLALVRRAQSEHKTLAPLGSQHSFGNIPIFDANTIAVQIRSDIISSDPDRLDFVGSDPLMSQLSEMALKKWLRPTGEFSNPRILRRQQQPRTRPIKEYLVRVGAGVKLSNLNNWLRIHGMALPSIGQIEYQTVAGFVSTSTHGSSFLFSSTDASVVALEVVVVENGVVRKLRLEPDEFQRNLLDAAGSVQWNTARFHAFRVSLGMLGILTAVVFAVHDDLNLVETRRKESWWETRQMLLNPRSEFWPKVQNLMVDPKNPTWKRKDLRAEAEQRKSEAFIRGRHFEFFLNPYTFPLRGLDQMSTLVIVKSGSPLHPEGKGMRSTTRNLLIESMTNIRSPGFQRIQNKAFTTLHLTNVMNSLTLQIQKDKFYLADSVSVQTHSFPTEFRTIASEIAIPIQGNFQEKRHKIAQRVEAISAWLRSQSPKLNIPLVIRFTTRNPAPLSMLYSPDPNMWFMLVEATTLTDTFSPREYRKHFLLIQKLERFCIRKFAAVPHLGKTQTNDNIRKLNPEAAPGWPVWRETFRKYHAGIFNAATARLDRYGLFEEE